MLSAPRLPPEAYPRTLPADTQQRAVARRRATPTHGGLFRSEGEFVPPHGRCLRSSRLFFQLLLLCTDEVHLLRDVIEKGRHLLRKEGESRGHTSRHGGAMSASAGGAAAGRQAAAAPQWVVHVICSAGCRVFRPREGIGRGELREELLPGMLPRCQWSRHGSISRRPARGVLASLSVFLASSMTAAFASSAPRSRSLRPSSTFFCALSASSRCTFSARSCSIAAASSCGAHDVRSGRVWKCWKRPLPAAKSI